MTSKLFWSKTKEIEIFKGSSFYGKFLKSFYTLPKKVELDLNNNKITRALFFHLYKVMNSEWEMRIKFKRYIKHPLSDLFQDLVAFYLNKTLDKLEIILEFKKNKIRPDILIKYKDEDKYLFAIEVKTTIGWARQAPRKQFGPRINKISKIFGIPKENVIYIFESPLNVSKKFASRYWDHGKSKPKDHPKTFPYSNIYPLFYVGPDPYYWKYERDFDKDSQIKIFKRNEILKKAEENIICKIEDIIKKIRAAANTG